MKFNFRHTNKKIETFFEKEFELEAIRREKQRAGLLAILFSVGLVVSVFIIYFQERTPFGNSHYNEIIDAYLACMAIYETSVWNYYRRGGKGLFQNFPLLPKYGNSTFEITCLTFVLYLTSREFHHPILVMISPPTYIYFLFIILSTLRLNFGVSFYTSLISGIQFFVLSYILLEKPSASVEHEIHTSTPLPYLAKSIILIMAGSAAGFVANQIKKSIQSSIENTEKQNQILTLFGQQVSPEVVQAMLAEDGALQSKHMKVAVLFLDIRGFTLYADKHTPDEVVAYQNAFFSIIIETVTSHGGIVNQFLGDGCMISFGAPVTMENPAENAVKAGLEILENIDIANRSEAIPFTNVNMGIHVGDVVTGNIGTEIRQQYNITGTVVIQAARIEQLNKEFDSKILVSQEVVNDITAIPIESRLMGYVNLKGIEEQISIWKLA